MANRRETVAAVVVTFNRKQLLMECLNALLNQTYELDSVIIIDNNSTDGTYELLKERGYIDNEIIDYVRLNENTGGAGGFHEGIKRGYEKGYDWLWIMDDDVKPDKECLNILMKYKEKGKVLIPLRLSSTLDIREFPAIKYDLSNPFLKQVRRLSVYTKYNNYLEMPEILEVEDFSFEGPLINREVIKKIGYPKSELFISGDDTEYALRIRYKLKEKLLLISRARIFRMLDSYNNSINWRTYYSLRNYYYIHRIYGENYFVKIKPIFLFIGLIIKNIIKGNFQLKKFRIAFYALVDAYSKVLPRRFMPGDKI
jgi:GT2 family glycosyltransferase